MFWVLVASIAPVFLNNVTAVWGDVRFGSFLPQRHNKSNLEDVTERFQSPWYLLESKLWPRVHTFYKEQHARSCHLQAVHRQLPQFGQVAELQVARGSRTCIGKNNALQCIVVDYGSMIKAQHVTANLKMEFQYLQVELKDNRLKMLWVQVAKGNLKGWFWTSKMELKDTCLKPLRLQAAQVNPKVELKALKWDVRAVQCGVAACQSTMQAAKAAEANLEGGPLNLTGQPKALHAWPAAGAARRAVARCRARLQVAREIANANLRGASQNLTGQLKAFRVRPAAGAARRAVARCRAKLQAAQAAEANLEGRFQTLRGMFQVFQARPAARAARRAVARCRARLQAAKEVAEANLEERLRNLTQLKAFHARPAAVAARRAVARCRSKGAAQMAEKASLKEKLRALREKANATRRGLADCQSEMQAAQAAKAHFEGKSKALEAARHAVVRCRSKLQETQVAKAQLEDELQDLKAELQDLRAELKEWQSNSQRISDSSRLGRVIGAIALCWWLLRQLSVTHVEDPKQESLALQLVALEAAAEPEAVTADMAEALATSPSSMAERVVSEERPVELNEPQPKMGGSAAPAGGVQADEQEDDKDEDEAEDDQLPPETDAEKASTRDSASCTGKQGGEALTLEVPSMTSQNATVATTEEHFHAQGLNLPCDDSNDNHGLFASPWEASAPAAEECISQLLGESEASAPVAEASRPQPSSEIEASAPLAGTSASQDDSDAESEYLLL